MKINWTKLCGEEKLKLIIIIYNNNAFVKVPRDTEANNPWAGNQGKQQYCWVESPDKCSTISVTSG